MNKNEIQFLKTILKNINIVRISEHAKEKQLINIKDVKNIIKLKKTIPKRIIYKQNSSFCYRENKRRHLFV